MNILTTYKHGLLRFLKNAGRKIGLEVHHNNARSREDLRLIHFLKHQKIEQIFDVGANRGQFAEAMFHNGYDGKIVSVEPLTEAHATLTKRAAASGFQWRVAPRMALSDATGEATFYIAKNDTSSSLLQPNDAMAKIVNVIETSQTETVPLDTLDALVEKFQIGGHRSFLKLDIQGTEDRVLRSSKAALDQLQGVLVETSFADIYEKQAGFLDLVHLLEGAGFKIWDINSGLRDPQSLQLYQADVIFFK